MRDYLTGRGIPFVERNIRKDPAARRELLERTGQLVVPIVFVDDCKVVGWDRERLDEVLGG